MTSQYLDRPPRTEREAELERALIELIVAIKLNDGDKPSARLAEAICRAEKILKGGDDE